MEKILAIDGDSAGQHCLRPRFETIGFELSVAGDGALAMVVSRFSKRRFVVL
jgi:hypothetical protein